MSYAEARRLMHSQLLCWGAKFYEAGLYVLDTPYGALYVSVYARTGAQVMGVHARWEEPARALAASLIGDVNPHSGKWNFLSHQLFLAAMQRCVFPSRCARVADAVYSAWRKVFDEIIPPSFAPYSPGFGDNPAIRECANNSVIEENAATCCITAREAIAARTNDGRWPALTEEQIERFVAAAIEAERNVI